MRALRHFACILRVWEILNKIGSIQMRILVSLFFAVAFSLPVHGSNRQLSDHTENVLLHVLSHELGHALIREFDLPLLGNEEVIADEFATIFLHDRFPDQAGAIISARVDAFLLEKDDETIFAEHSDDARRAGRATCLLFGLDPQRYLEWAQRLGMTGQEAKHCVESAPEIARGWRRVLAPLAMPPTVPTTEVRVIFGEGPMKMAMENSRAFQQMKKILESFDWHSQITLHGDHCDEGASWSRGRRRILLCDDYVLRFEEQARLLSQ
ncbi:MAG: DUF4344 domain-containing metallopeptidase [Cognatishimia sp.]